MTSRSGVRSSGLLGLNARRWNVIALLGAFITSAVAVLVPVVSHETIDSSGVRTSRTESLLSDMGPGVLVVVAIPLLLVGLPLLLPPSTMTYRIRLAVTVLLGALVVLGAASIGLFVIPTAAAMVMALSADRSDGSAPAGASVPPAN